jgi:two-component system, NtrC family, response regulator HydG
MSSRRILVVDDDRAMIRSLCDVLRLSGWETASAGSGEEAVEKVGTSQYDAILMDVKMAGMTGVDALRAIRAKHPTLPVVLMTAYSSTALLQQADDWGATKVLFKPLPIPSLLELLKWIGDTRRAVLVVDDDREFLRSLGDLLKARCFDVFEASSLERAVSELHRHPLPVVLLDLKLDDLDPQTVVRSIRRAHAGAAIILLSGHPALLDEVSRALNDTRVIGHLPKPVPPDQLTHMLDAVLG